jgi:hypothetical protein
MDTGQVIGNAVVTVQGIKNTAITGPDGGFIIEGLPPGTSTVMVTTPQSEQLGTAMAEVPLAEGRTTRVSLAVLPLDVAAPQQIQVDPTDTTVDVKGRIAYRAQVVGAGGEVLDGIEPTWVVQGGVGQITPQGIFTAENVGTGTVKAYSGNAQRTADVTVVASRPPQVSSFRVNPQTLPATGGQVFISAALRDGDGILPEDVTAQILPAGGEPIAVPLQVTNPETAVRCPSDPTCFADASFGANYQVPANDNAPTEDGVQAPETYAVSIQVRDRSGMSTQSEFLEFVVQGIDTPPARPGI